MGDVAVKVDKVYKRFRKGEQFDSLRDLVPALTGRLFKRTTLDEKSGRDFWALEDVSFEVQKGEAFGIIGHNGAGKSTMLKILSRIMQPTKGRMILHGRLSALIEVTAGFHQDLTGRENIYLNGTILGMKRREIDAKLDAIVDFSGLEDFIDTPVKRYSSGMFARLGFSVAAHVDPEVLIVDEVLSVGDFVFQQKCINRMNEVIKGGTTVLFVSHNLRAVSDLCSRGLLMDHGKVRTIGAMNHVINEYMHSIRVDVDANDGKAARIANVRLRRGNEECVQFNTGDKAMVDIEVIARRQCRKMAVVLYLTDEDYYELFNTSTERLGHAAYDLESGDSLRVTFELEMNMSHGAYHACVALFRYDTDSTIDERDPAASFFVGPEPAGYQGIVNCKPAVVGVQLIRNRDGME